MTTNEPSGVWGTFEWCYEGYTFTPYATEADARASAATELGVCVGFVPWGTPAEDVEDYT